MSERVISSGGLTSSERVTGTQSLEKAIDVLEFIAGAPRPGVTLADCTGVLGFSKATTQRMLLTLTRRNLLHFDEELGVYSLGMLTARLGSEYLGRIDYRRVALPALRAIVAETGETAHLGILSGADVVYIELVDSPQPVRFFSKVGDSIPAYATAIGKAILAHVPEDRLAEHLPAQLVARTVRTITDPGRLRQDLASVRERGYAIDDSENREGILGFAAPIFDHTGTACAALSVAGPTSRVSGEAGERFGGLVVDAAQGVSRALGAPEALLG
ncbi:IclR family transcriptional regulator [Leucobacter allii]|uniref:IclR family transcriptional regulator n=1 Tax=Leucobacter allii TaxID=2932247 RepID=UPI001FD0F6B1|nr:IclR family transcriptional regulator [Leucobacter allii]UOR02554.1 IclR family transcriptional regulator [Leucobacter allii]